MKITQSWKRNTPTTDGYSLTVTCVYSSHYLHEIEEVEKKLPKGIIVIPDWFCADGERRCEDACPGSDLK